LLEPTPNESAYNVTRGSFASAKMKRFWLVEKEAWHSLLLQFMDRRATVKRYERLSRQT